MWEEGDYVGLLLGVEGELASTLHLFFLGVSVVSFSCCCYCSLDCDKERVDETVESRRTGAYTAVGRETRSIKLQALNLSRTLLGPREGLKWLY